MDAALGETIEDLRAGFAELLAANGAEPQHRRSLKSVLDDVYLIHERRAQDGGAEEHRQRAELSVAGKMSLGLVFLRGLSTHQLTRPTSAEELYPSARLFPSNYLYLGTNLTWITGLDVPPPRRKYEKLNAALYAETLAGLPVLPTIDVAIGFLTAPNY